MTLATSLYDLTDWIEIDCRASDRVRGAQPVFPGSSLTDLDGEFGDAVTYTEWWEKATDMPVLRDYVWEPLAERRCEHFVPKNPASNLGGD